MMANRHSSPWNKETIQTLRDLWPKHSAGEVARIMNAQYSLTLSRNSVVGKARRLGLEIKQPANSRAKGATVVRHARVTKPPKAKTGHIKPRAAVKMHTTAVVYSEELLGWRASQSGSKPPEPLPVEVKTALEVLTLEDVQKSGGCRYAFGDSPFNFCGRKRVVTPSTDAYCDEHARRTHARPGKSAGSPYDQG